ncbi:helix-turn-helix domain-containing protein [Paenactinomyces guangxiensis]|uniref:Tetratricopeptide repeat protein n=1 Tax=Paenactinomyces guangxiensis TaxID=1490290 RepID=A0A7W1WT84_9BACL|nr:tetratricopeptide repeat protein [Paenactinomyces guangxiensis]MBA4495568.1 tetratricopeptide repeat protein [Paenactinomyces guangxiensis]MBH8592826.1 tetratricopeptide repeat protein [Paenactinomyces guangxiensis]
MNFTHVGDLIRKARKEKGMRLQDLADDMIPPSTLSAIERGECRNPNKINYVLRKMEINIHDLSEREKEQEKDRKLDLMIIENRINSKPREALSKLSKLPAEYRGPLFYFLKGRCYYKTQQFDRAVELFHQALKILEKSIGDRSNLKPGCLNHLSVIAFKRGDKAAALRHAEEGLESFDLNGERGYYYTSLLTNKAIYLRGLGRAEDALKTLEKIDLNSSEIDIEAVIGIYDLQAKLKKDIRLYDEAESCANKGLEIARINHNCERQIELYITLGDIFKENGRLKHSEKCLLAAIDLKEEITRRKWLILEAYLKLGIIYFEKKDFQLSNKMLGKALKIAQKEKDMIEYSQALLYIGKSYLSESEYQEALAAFMEVYELHSNEKNDLEALYGLMQVYLLLNDEPNYIKYSHLYFRAKGLGGLSYD